MPQGVVGAEDLDDYGSWRSVPDYGTVWVPDRAPRDWAPYHDGHWAWVDPWGWTWIDDQPYGYAVSHYGRWIRTPDTWAWVPAPAQARPVYAPALVAFVGAVLTLGGRSGPGVGWFPLAPHEAYRPPYHASPTYITNVNVSNTVIRQTQIVNNVTHIRDVNRNVPGAMVAMPAQQFAQAASTRRAGLLLPPGVARAAPVLAAPQARPLPQARVGTAPAGRLPPAPVMQRVAVTRALPSAAFAPAGAHAAHGAHGMPAPGRPGCDWPPTGRCRRCACCAPRSGSRMCRNPHTAPKPPAARLVQGAGHPLPAAGQPPGARAPRPDRPVAALAGVRPDVVPGHPGAPLAPHAGARPQAPDFAHGPVNGPLHAPPAPEFARGPANGAQHAPPEAHGQAAQPLAQAPRPQPSVAHPQASAPHPYSPAPHPQQAPHAGPQPHPSAPAPHPPASHPQPAPHAASQPPAPHPQPPAPQPHSARTASARTASAASTASATGPARAAAAARGAGAGTRRRPRAQARGAGRSLSARAGARGRCKMGFPDFIAGPCAGRTMPTPHRPATAADRQYGAAS
ncbi:DUF6600 domain-containing protein [Massilia phosphatilytica]